jgi:hypothetical protein
MLVEGAWAAAKTPGPLRALYERARPRTAQDADRGRGDRPQARRALLDHDRARRGLPVRAAVACRQDARDPARAMRQYTTSSPWVRSQPGDNTDLLRIARETVFNLHAVSKPSERPRLVFSSTATF